MNVTRQTHSEEEKEIDKLMQTKPLLRWAGGKRWLTKSIEYFIPTNINYYYEPFCGSCAIFYSLYNILPTNKIILSDSNEDLINFYKVLQEQPTRLLGYLENYKNTETFYYKIRSKQTKSMIEKAAIFYFLNRTSFNGLYRVNLQGVYNVPYGFKNYKVLFDKDTIIQHSEILKKASFICCDFEKSVDLINEDDFFFFDPPYTVSHNDNGFIKYNKNLFSLNDQYRLQYLLDKINNKKAKYLLTNAHHNKIYEIFSQNSYCYEINRYTSISGNISGRKSTMEYIFTNYEVQNVK